MTGLPAVLQGRNAAERLMIDVGRISRPSGPAVFDPGTLLETAPSTTVHEGPCRLRMPSAVETTVMFGEQNVTMTRFVVWFPHDVVDIQIGDVITFVKSHDPVALGRTFRVVWVSVMSHSVKRKVGCEVVDA